MEADDPIDDAWGNVLADFSDEEAHRRFLALCAGLDRLADAGSRYRQVRDAAETDGDAAREAAARAQIDALLGLAMQRLAPLRAEPPGPSGKTVLLLLALGVGGAIIATALLLLARLL